MRTACLLLVFLTWISFGIDLATGQDSDLPKGKVPNIVLIVVDTLGAQQVGVFGGGTSFTPTINSLAAQGAVFKRAYSSAPWTKPAIASILSAQLPSVHKVRRIRDKFLRTEPTLAERLTKLGYRSGGYVSHTLLAPGSGYERGFEAYQVVSFQGKIHDAITSAQVTDAGVGFLRERVEHKEAPFFLFLHYFDAHYNYMHHASFDRTSWYKGSLTPGMTFSKFRRAFPGLNGDDVRYMLALHQEEIAYIDQQIGRLLDYLRATGVMNDTLVIFTADHGEEFGEHGGVGHGHSLYNEVVHVPLLFYWPSRVRSQAISYPVGTIDITPTVLDFLSVPVDSSSLQGHSLKAILDGAPTASPRPRVIMEVDYNSSFVGAVEDSFKMKVNKKNQKWELYDVVVDPKERNNLMGDSADLHARLKRAIEDYRRVYQGDVVEPEIFDPKSEAEGMDSEAVKQLESLGYL